MGAARGGHHAAEGARARRAASLLGSRRRAEALSASPGAPPAPSSRPAETAGRSGYPHRPTPRPLRSQLTSPPRAGAAAGPAAAWAPPGVLRVLPPRPALAPGAPPYTPPSTAETSAASLRPQPGSLLSPRVQPCAPPLSELLRSSSPTAPPIRSRAPHPERPGCSHASGSFLRPPPPAFHTPTALSSSELREHRVSVAPRPPPRGVQGQPRPRPASPSPPPIAGGAPHLLRAPAVAGPGWAGRRAAARWAALGKVSSAPGRGSSARPAPAARPRAPPEGRAWRRAPRPPRPDPSASSLQNPGVRGVLALNL